MRLERLGQFIDENGRAMCRYRFVPDEREQPKPEQPKSLPDGA